jgi:hypothetical protein
MRSIIAIFALKDDFFNNVPILRRDYDNIIKTVISIQREKTVTQAIQDF